MTTRISQLGDISTVQGNVLVPLVSNITGNLTTVKGSVDTLKAFIVAATEANIVTANIGMKGYVDSVTTAWTANAGQQLSDLGNLYANASSQQSTLNSLLANAGSQSDLIIGINANVTAANLGMKGYVDNAVSTANIGIIGYIDQGNTIQSNQISAANVGIIGYIGQQITNANVGLKGYTDLANTIQSNQISAANVGIIGYIGQQITNANVGLKGYTDLANTIQSNQISAANVGIIGYIDQGNTIQSNQISAANLGMKGYVDSVASQSIYGNANVSSLITTNGLTNYSNVNTKAYAESMGYQNFSNVNVAAYVTTANSAVIGYVDNKVSTANIGIIGYIDLGNTIQSNQISSANLGMKGYVDNAITTITGGAPAILDTLGELANALGADANLSVTLTSYIGNVNANISTANIGMKGYVDSVASQSLYGNTNVSALITTNGLTNYSNVNTKAYTESMGFTNYSNVNVSALITTNGLTNYSNVNVIAYLAGNITVGNIAGSVNGFAIGYRDVPQITAANVTLISSDAGKHYYGSNTNPVTLTIPLNSSVAFGNGTAISIVNQGTGNITISNVAGVQLYLAGNATGGSRTLTSYGMATLLKVQVNTWFINGTGVV